MHVHHRVLHLESFPFSYGAPASVEYRRRSKKLALHGRPRHQGWARAARASSSGGHGGAATGRRGASSSLALGALSAVLVAPPAVLVDCPGQPPAAFHVARPRCSAGRPRRSPRPATVLVPRPGWPPSWLTCRGEHRLLPVAGGGRRCGHEILLAGAGVLSHYPRGYCPLASLGSTHGGASDDVDEGGGEEVGQWDPPVSPFRAQREEPHQEEEEEDDEECEWLDLTSFLRSQEGVSDVCTTTAAMEEILAFARCPAAAGEQGFAEFMAGYCHRNLSEEEYMELMWRMSEEGLALGCAHLFRWLREKQPVPISPMAWLTAFVSLGRCHMADVILEIVARLPMERDFHEAVLYNAAISAVAYCRRYDGAWEVFELMEKNNVQPDHRTSAIMLNIMKKSKASAKDAWEFFQRMNRKGVNWSFDVGAALINIFCFDGLKKEALIIQLEMEKRGIASNTSIYETLMKAYCKSNQIEEAEGLFVEMKEKGLQATTTTYNILMDAYSRRLQTEVVESLLFEMQDLGIRPSAGSYNCLISAYGRQKKMSGKAEDAFLRMKREAAETVQHEKKPMGAFKA
ncbi:pentatricopeptide repeat-containing protein At5g50280, chloroplastic isoform X3 [Sorghum bicolor]|uniref:pentatricopeptide repeat-containing protein At5g50280, chloroplastic isoform X3 n=1 Tax=Sorghum bicolor TaxID=4558 RepID=UPI000B4246B8|nr:pentatricopeptide repeat-containing protein At5g50280, chloroplastic isoform X3 [Sorghum bicolor]|eukprot:XP_021310075.1 pentatricopeptide repeat-containing protein At5g50280, chloroplastic isoform X3 [Sorghum bicolor]